MDAKWAKHHHPLLRGQAKQGKANNCKGKAKDGPSRRGTHSSDLSLTIYDMKGEERWPTVKT